MVRRLLRKTISSYKQFQTNKMILHRVSKSHLLSYKGVTFTNRKNEICVEFSMIESDQSCFESVLISKILPDIIFLGGSIIDIQIETDVFTASARIKLTSRHATDVGYNVIFKLFVEKNYHILFPEDFKNIFYQDGATLHTAEAV